jgi:ParB-like chromosome segregation protein Spo0J
MKTFIQILNEKKVLKFPASKLKIDVHKDSIVDDYVRRIKSGEKIVPSFLKKNDIDVLGKHRILDGNHRAAAYRQLGKKVPVVFVDRLHMLKKMGGGMSVEDYFKKELK